MRKLKLFSLLMLLFVGVTSMRATDYELVTNVASLSAGDKIIIVEAGGTKAISTTQNTNNRGAAAVTVSNNKITPGAAVQILTLSKVDTYWELYTGSGYLYASSSNSNQMKTQTTNNANGQWTISITDGVASIVANRTGRNTMQYNSQSDIFACYGGASQTNLKIFKEVKVAPTLSSISVKTAPTKVTYTEGEFFDPAGLVITATYSDASTSDVAYKDNEDKFSFSPALNEALETTDAQVTITYGEKSANQAITVNAAAACSNEVNVYAGATEHGSFNLSTDKVCGDGDGGIVFITSITPAEGYELDEITATVGDIDKENNKVTGITENTTITVTFKELPKYTVSFSTGAGNPAQVDIKEASYGAGITLPAGPTPACSADGWTFAGWKETSAVDVETTTAPTLLAAGANYKPAEDCTLYAVYKRTGGGDGAPIGTTMWAEAFSDFKAANQPSAPGASTTVYGSASISYKCETSYTQVYEDANAGGASPEILIPKSSRNGYFEITGIPTGLATTLTLSYKTNQAGMNVTSATDGVAIGDRSGTNPYSRTITIDKEKAPANFSLKFAMGSDTNARLDNISVEVATSSSAGTTYYLSAPTCCTKHTITVDDKIANGSVTASLAEACENTKVKLTPTPAAHCQFVSWNVKDEDEGSIDVAADSTFTMPDGDVTVSATFEEIKNAVTFATPTGGTLVVKHNDATVSTGDLIKEGETVKLVYAADAVNHYIGGTVSVKDASNADVDVAADSTFVMPGKAVTISASFTATYAINIVADGGNVDLDYTAGGAAEGYAIAGTEIIATATADDAHTFSALALSENVTEKDIDANVAMFTMPAEAVTITATFAVKTTPTIGVSTDIIEFAPVDYKGALAAQTFNVSGAALAAGKLSISCDNAAFTVSPAEIDVDGALAATEVTVTPKTTSCGTFDGTITISGGGAEAKEVLVSLTVNKLAHGLVWSSDAATVTIDGDDNVFPTLSNPHKLQIELSSEDDAIATFDEGNIVLVAPGTVKIYANTVGPNDTVALPAENAVFYTLTVQETYTAKWYVNGEELTESTQNAVAGTDLEFPSYPTKLADDCAEMVFKGWAEAPIDGKQDDAPAYTEKTKMPEANVNFYAVFASEVPGKDVTIQDHLTPAVVGEPSNYTDWTGKTATSSAVYAGTSTGGEQYIQIRSNDAKSGVVSTTSGGKVTKITVDWNSETKSGRTLDVYGKNTAYDSSVDLYTEDNGDLIGSIVYGTSTELTISDDYAYIGFRSNDGAMYLDEVVIDWKVPGETTYTDYMTTCPSCNEVTFVKAGEDNGNTFALQVAGVAKESVKTCDVVSVNVVASPATGYELSSFAVSGVDGVTYNAGVISIPADAEGTLTATATFTKINYTVTMAQTGDASATISGNQENKHYGDEITVTANEPTGYVFLGWEASPAVTFADATALETTFNLPNSNVTVTAKFAKILTISEAIPLIPNEGDTYDNAVVEGYISSAATSDKEGTLTYNIRAIDANGFLTGSELQVFRGKGINGANFSNLDDVKIGAKVFIYGQLKNYYGTRELNSNNYLLSYDAGSYLGVDIYGEATETEYEVGDEFEFDGLSAKHAWSNGYAEAIASPIWAADPTIIAANTTSVSVTAKDDDNTSAPVEVDVTVLTHAVTFSAPDHGTLVVKNAGAAITSGDTFVKGTILTVEATPASIDYMLTALTAGEESIIASKQFEIGAADVIVSATFAAKTADAPISWGKDGETINLTGDAATLQTLTNEEHLAVTYSSDNTSVANISNEAGHEGEITLVAGGKANISATYTATLDGVYKTTTVTYALTVVAPNFYIAGTFTEWGTNKIPVYGESYVIADLEATAYEFKVIDGEAWKGFGNLTTSEIVAGLYGNGDDNVCFTLAEAGDVTITYNASVFKAEGNFVPQTVEIGGSWTSDWSEGKVTAILSGDKKSATAKKTLTKGEWYNFKPVINDDWLGCSAGATGINRTDNSVTGFVSGGSDNHVYFQADQTGEYEFTWTFGTQTLTVDFPEKTYAITFDAPTNGSLTILNGSESIASGDEFVAGTELDVVATPASGYLLATLTANGEDIKSSAKVIIGTADVVVVATFQENPTGIDNTDASEKVVKTMENGVLIIRRGDKTYNGQGQLIK